MEMVKISNNTFIPMAMSIVGTVLDGRPNFMAVGWVTRANFKPPMVATGIGKNHATHDGILAAGAFSLCIPGRSLLLETDYVGLVSGRDQDKSDVFDVFFGELPGAPLIRGAAVCLECRVVNAVDLPTNTLFVGEITGAWGDPEILAEKVPDYGKAGAFFLTMPDNRYWAMGDCIGKAWSDGRGCAKRSG